MNTATPVNAMVPILDYRFDGQRWLHFAYSAADPDPWTWPDVVRCDGVLFQRTGFNSDSMQVYYRETAPKALAYPVKGGA